MAVNADQLLRRYEYLLGERRLWEPVWQEIATYILPRKTGITFQRTPGQKLPVPVDSTAIHANELLAASMQGALTSSAVKWFRLKTRREELNDLDHVARWLDEAADRVYLALQQSNFSAELQEVYLDLGAFGTGALYAEEREPRPGRPFGGFRFQALAIGTYVIAENAEGRVDTLFREIKMSARAAYDRWKAAVGDRIMRLIEAGKQDEMVTILHCVYPRPDGRPGAVARRKPWASVYLHKDARHVIAESGYDRFPFFVPRWTKVAPEIWGRGPGHTALPDVKTLNKAVELTLKAWAKAIDPPMKARHDGVIGNVKIRPGDVTSVTDMEALQPLDTRARFDVGQVKEENLRTSIRDAFFNNQLQLPNKTIMTATEVERQYELMQRHLGPTLGRLESELLNPLIEWAFGTLLRRGALPSVPPELMPSPDNPDGEDIDIEYEGPLARAQRASDVAAIERTLAIVMPLSQVEPTVLDNFDFDVIARITADRNQLPPQVKRDRAAVVEIRAARQEAAAREQRMATMDRAATAAGRVAPFVKAAAEAGLTPPGVGGHPATSTLPEGV